jgi:hypothetical protein
MPSNGLDVPACQIGVEMKMAGKHKRRHQHQDSGILNQAKALAASLIDSSEAGASVFDTRRHKSSTFWQHGN